MKEENKNKIDKKQVFTKVMAGILLLAMILAACSTFIYYIVANI